MSSGYLLTTYFHDIIFTTLHNQRDKSHLVYKLMCSCFDAFYYGESERYFFVSTSECHDMTPFTGKWVKNPKKSAIINNVLLKNHDVSFEDLKIILKESNKFKLHVKESLLIRHDKTELNRNIHSYPIELFDWLLSWFVFYEFFIEFYDLYLI